MRLGHRPVMEGPPTKRRALLGIAFGAVLTGGGVGALAVDHRQGGGDTIVAICALAAGLGSLAIGGGAPAGRTSGETAPRWSATLSVALVSVALGYVLGRIVV